MAFSTELHSTNKNHQSTGSDQSLWQTRVEGILDGALGFFADPKTGIFIEQACETQTPMTCDTDMLTFKGILVRSMAAATKLAPFISTKVESAIATQASAAALQCSGGNNGRMCGFKWASEGTWDGTTGAGQQMAALEAVISTMISNSETPVTNATGGTSTGKVNAGNTGKGATSLDDTIVVTTKDRAGAGIITALVLVACVGGVWWMALD